MALNDILECRVFTQHNPTTQVQVAVRHYKVTVVGPGGEPSMNDYAGSLATDWAAHIKPIVTNSWTFRGVQVRRIRPTETAAVMSVNGQGTGTRVELDLPTQIAYLFSLRAATAPTKVRGRFYLSGFAEIDNNGTGGVEVAVTTLTNTMGTFLQTNRAIAGVGGTSSTLTNVVYSPKHLEGYPITQVLRYTRWATQRRRSGINRGDSTPI